MMKTREMAKAFAPQEVEERLYQFWEENGFFRPKVDPAKQPFTIIMPPPNVTGDLHLGHALTAAVEDAMIRWHRMRGDPTLWLPGEDHSGIAAQVVVERLIDKEGLTRQQLGREAFLKRVWDWSRKYARSIADQHRKLGASCDWSRERFTLDPGPSRAVRTTFARLYAKGLLYRGERIVNWCPRCSTVLSDLETDHQEVQGHLWHVRYPLVGGEGEPRYVTVATTRPETILGDTGVAVNPDDERYAGLVGKMLRLPVLGREIPIVADTAVDVAFGTGAVKVTPGHDPTDFEIGQRHNLPIINIMNLDATLNANAGPYAGLDRYEARRQLLAQLEREGLLVKTEEYSHAVGHCDRCKTVVEPLVSKQWYVDIKPLAEPAIAAVREGRIRIVPDRFAKVYLNWMENIRDWCVSRQLWWGHRIPVWYCQDCEEIVVPSPNDPMQDPTTCPKCGGNLRQDEDVLDTWFSSGLWPHSTLGWPDDTEDLRYFYPTSVMETGYDILFFWVARMIMMGIENTGEIPFHTVYLHGLIRDEKGEKMSKMKGNVINPLVVMAQYGTDALRFTLATGTTPGNDMRLSQEKLEGGRNFANKIWNAARFILGELARAEAPLAPLGAFETLDLEDRWLLSRVNRLVAEVDRLFGDYQFGEAGRLIYEFLWGEFCDWYIELAKVRLRQPRPGAPSPLPVLVDVLDRGLKLLHPFMPFVTEEIWQHLMVEAGGLAVVPAPPQSDGRPLALINQPWPQVGPTDEAAENAIEALIGTVRGIRNARTEYGVEAGRWVEAIVQAGPLYDVLSERETALAGLARVRPLRLERELAAKPEQAVAVIVGSVETYLPLAGLVDLEQERARLRAELEGVETQIASLQGRLANESFTAKAPPAVVAKERERLTAAEERAARLNERLASLGG
ncbi:MAG: valine--tRNA ligase [Chloroflexota bacterium]